MSAKAIHDTHAIAPCVVWNTYNRIKQRDKPRHTAIRQQGIEANLIRTWGTLGIAARIHICEHLCVPPEVAQWP